MEITQEQVDIVALGSNSYLWLKNTTKIRILIHTLMLESQIEGLEQRNPHILVYYMY